MNTQKIRQELTYEPTKTRQNAHKWAIGLILGAAALIGLIGSVYAANAVLIIIATGALAVIIFKYPRIGFGLLGVALFLEADALSLNFGFGKIRFYHLITLILFTRVIVDIALGKKKWRKSFLDWPIVVYLAINALTILVAPDKIVATKIMGLLILLALLFVSLYQYLDSIKKIKQLTTSFLAGALVSGLIGLYQIVAVALNKYLMTALWTGPIMHSDILPFGRPYGTFVEPDWFGAFMMIALVVSLTLLLARHLNRKQLKNLSLTLFFLVVTLLSAVRGAWLGLLAAGSALVFLNNKIRRTLNLKILAPAFILLVIGVTLGIYVFPDLTTALLSRAHSLFSSATITGEPRFVTMQNGWHLFLSRPLIGFGPGAYKTLGVVPFVSSWQAVVRNLEPFQTNAILTILIDTGIIGLAAVGWGLVVFLRQIKKVFRLIKIRDTNSHKRNDAKLTITESTGAAQDTKLYWLAWLSALAGLIIAYQVTAGLWLGLSWFILAMSVATTKLVLDLNEKET